VRQHACTGLGKLKWKKAAAALLLRTKDESPVVRREAIRALGRMRAKQALTVAIDMLKDPSPEPQLAAMIALGELGDAKGLAPLRRFLSDSSEQVRLASARGLCMLGDRQAKALAFKMLASVEPNQRLDGLWIMDAVQAPWARKELAKRLADADFSVRVAAASALVRQGDGRGVEALIVAAQDAPPAEHERLEQAIVDLPITPADRKKILEGARRK
jgi:HEAT repeat protein